MSYKRGPKAKESRRERDRWRREMERVPFVERVAGMLERSKAAGYKREMWYSPGLDMGRDYYILETEITSKESHAFVANDEAVALTKAKEVFGESLKKLKIKLTRFTV